MIITCPNCKTQFNLPETQIISNSKLRCSICKHVFPLPENNNIHHQKTDLNLAVDTSRQPKKSKKTFKKILILILIIVVSAVIYSVLNFPQSNDFIQKLLSSKKEEQPADLTHLIALNGVVQYNINNEKIGNISVIEGKVVNGFPDPRELIRLEASLYDKKGNVLISKQQLAGTSVSLFQLQVLGEQELEHALTNKIDILANNTNIPEKGEVPFMIVFYNPPENATEFGVKVIDARLPPK